MSVDSVRYAVEVKPVVGGRWHRIGLDSKGRILWWKHRDRIPMRGGFNEAELEAARVWARRRGMKVQQHLIERWPFLVGDLDCDTDLLDRLNRVGRRLGKVIRVRSGRRTMAEQWALYKANMQAPGQPFPGHALTAYPNANAPHVLGIAADCGIDGVDIGEYPGARDAMRAEGLCLCVRTEDWHVQVGTNWVG